MAAGRDFTERYLKVMFASLKDATPEEVQEELERCRAINRKPVRVPRFFRSFFSCTDFQASNGFQMQVFQACKEDYLKSGKRILFLHGGACIYQPVFFHWRFVHDIALRTHLPVVMPVYPKAPEYLCSYSMEVLMEFYQHYAAENPDKELVLMGDSIGGCLALAMAQEIRRRGWKPVADLVVLSPSVDITYPKTQEMLAIEPFDKMLQLDRIKLIMNLWRGKLPANHPWVSPIYGDLRSLPDHTMVVYGGDEILKVDAEMLAERCHEIGKPLYDKEFKGMFHTFPMFPVREGFEATREIAKRLRS